MGRNKDIKDVRVSESRRGRPQTVTNAEIAELRNEAHDLYEGSLEDLMDYMREMQIEPDSKRWNDAIAAWKSADDS